MWVVWVKDNIVYIPLLFIVLQAFLKRIIFKLLEICLFVFLMLISYLKADCTFKCFEEFDDQNKKERKSTSCNNHDYLFHLALFPKHFHLLTNTWKSLYSMFSTTSYLFLG